MKITIISGKRNSAKTTTLKRIVENKSEKFLGYFCESDKDKEVFYLRNVLNNDLITIMRTNLSNTKESIGKYNIIDNSFLLAEETLLSQIHELKGDNFSIVIDEIGRLELNGSGYNTLIKKLLKFNYDLIFCIRDEFVEDIIDKYDLSNIEIINV